MLVNGVVQTPQDLFFHEFVQGLELFDLHQLPHVATAPN